MTRVTYAHYCNQPAFVRALAQIEAGFEKEADRTELTPELEPVVAPVPVEEPVAVPA